MRHKFIMNVNWLDDMWWVRKGTIPKVYVRVVLNADISFRFLWEFYIAKYIDTIVKWQFNSLYQQNKTESN